MLTKFKYLFALLTVSFIVFSCNSGVGQNSKTKLSADDFEKMLNAEKSAQIVDVRTPEEFIGGHIKGALNINYNDPAFNENIRTVDKKNLYFYIVLQAAGVPKQRLL